MDRDGVLSQSDKVSMCNYWANRLCCDAADRAMQVHGGMGYSRHKPFEHIYRHHRRYRITEGAEEIQIRRVAGYMFGFMSQRAPKGVSKADPEMADVSAASSPSPFVAGVAPITETDAQVAAALQHAELAPLLPALAYLTGDMSLLRDDLRPDPLMLNLPFSGFTEEQQAEIRSLAVAALSRYRDGGCVPAAAPGDAQLLQMLEFTVGGAGMADYLPLLEELAYKGEDRRAPQWRADSLAPTTTLSAVIIGAGMSGILAGHRLQQAGVPFTILDKNDDVGGTWYEAAYPGCRVDNPNHNYSYSFAQRHDWPFHYSSQHVLHDYFGQCADAFDVRRHVQFGCTVRQSVWSDDDQTWTVTYDDEAGAANDHGQHRHQRSRSAEPAEVPHRDRGLRHLLG